MNDLTNGNPFDLPDIDKEDIPVLDDIVVPGSVHDNRTPIIPEPGEPGLADYNFDAPDADTSTGEKYFTENITPEEIAGQAIDKGVNETSIKIANELHIDIDQLNELIEKITTEVYEKLESKIEDSIKQAMENCLNDTLNQHKELIRESIHTHLLERLPEILNNIPHEEKN